MKSELPTLDPIELKKEVDASLLYFVFLFRTTLKQREDIERYSNANCSYDEKTMLPAFKICTTSLFLANQLQGSRVRTSSNFRKTCTIELKHLGISNSGMRCMAAVGLGLTTDLHSIFPANLSEKFVKGYFGEKYRKQIQSGNFTHAYDNNYFKIATAYVGS